MRDRASSTERRVIGSVQSRALNAARQSGEMTATERITLVQETGDQFGVLVFIPIYRDAAGSGTAAERRPNLSGFGLGVFRIGDLVEAAIGPARLSREDISIRILDTSAPVDRQLLYPKSAGTERESIEVPTVNGGAIWDRGGGVKRDHSVVGACPRSPREGPARAAAYPSPG